LLLGETGLSDDVTGFFCFIGFDIVHMFEIQSKRFFRKNRYKKGGYPVCLTLDTARQNG
jgi:hypothetical protein